MFSFVECLTKFKKVSIRKKIYDKKFNFYFRAL